jgi:flagella basal body P-ring formation protein FlgA
MNRIIKLSNFCFVMLTTSPMIVLSNNIYLHFKDSVMVNDTSITLCDIASIDRCESSIHSKLNEFKVGDAAPAGYSRFVNRDDLMTYLLQPSFKSLNIVASGAKRTCVSTDFIEKKIIDTKKELESFLANELEWPLNSWTLRILNENESFKIIDKPFTIKYSGLMDKRPKGNFNFLMSVVQGSKCTRVTVNCEMNVMLTAVVAITSIERGQVIQSSACNLKLIDVTHLGVIPYDELSQVIGKKALRAISEGQYINKQWVQEIPEIEKGDPVTIVVKKSTVRVVVSATARESGKIGEKIWVENSESHKLVRVMVKSKGIVTNL